MPAISIVIPTYERRRRLARVLEGLERQTVPPRDLEVIVVSDGSTDGTDDMLAALRPPFSLVPLRQENLGPAAARNAGVARATADLVLFLDDDVVPDTALIEEHLRVHRERGGGVAVIGPFEMPPDHEPGVWVDWEDAMLRKRYEALATGADAVTARVFYTGNASVERRAVVNAGGFSTAFRRAEDVELGYRLEAQGVRFVFTPRAIGWHYAERDYPSWSRMADAYGRADAEISARPDMRWLREALLAELRRRHPFVRALAHACAGRPSATHALGGALRLTAEGAYRLRLRRAARAACSGLFNARYYQAMSSAMGGRAAFLRETGSSSRGRPSATRARG